jgi:hypothetical protein
MKEFMELADYKITEGSEYGWQCYGPHAYQLSSWNGIHGAGGYSFSIVFDTRTHEVYELEVCDYTNDRAYRIVAENMREAHAQESSVRGVSLTEAWDGVPMIDLEIAEDFMEKSQAIKLGQEYDTRVSVPIEFLDHELLKYMKMAHERDVTFNQLVEEAIGHFIEKKSASKND